MFIVYVHSAYVCSLIFKVLKTFILSIFIAYICLMHDHRVYVHSKCLLDTAAFLGAHIAQTCGFPHLTSGKSELVADEICVITKDLRLLHSQLLCHPTQPQ